MLTNLSVVVSFRLEISYGVVRCWVSIERVNLLMVLTHYCSAKHGEANIKPQLGDNRIDRPFK